jgi:sugar lactone lactonase YvrE
MIRRALAAAFAGLVVLGLAATLPPRSAATGGDPIRGARPGYGPAFVDAIPNEAAIGPRLWMPGLDDWYNPQGLAVAGHSIFVAAYRSDAPRVYRGPCRVFRIDPASGAETGHFDVPAPCGHAGGLASAANGKLYVADTHTLFLTELAGAFEGRTPRVHVIPLGPGVTGGLAVSGAGEIWLGSYKKDGPGRLYRFATAALDAIPDGVALNAEDATAALAIPSQAQGAAIDGTGRLWVARSDLRWGELDRLDLASGQVEREYKVPPGIEGIAFDGAGRLWAVSEAGARHFYDQSWMALVMPFYPLIFAIDPGRLE